MTEKTYENVNLLDLKIEDAKAAVEKAQAALDVLLARKANEDKLSALKVGDTVTVKYGRAEKARNLTGNIIARDDETLAVQVGEGLDIQIVKVSVSAVQFDSAEPTTAEG